MKKILTIMALATVLGACNNASDSSSSTTSGSDSLSKTDSMVPPPPPVSADTSALSTDSSKVKKAMKK